MLFVKLAEFFQKLESTPSRLAMTEILAELFREVSEEEIPVVVYLSLGQLRPKFDRLEMGLAEKMVIRAIAQSTSLDLHTVVGEYKQIGDLGGTFIKLKDQNSKFKSEVQSSNLTILQTYDKLTEIARDGGQGSQERKVHILAELFKELDPLSGKFVARMVVGKLRLGFSDMTILDALSWMETGGKSQRKELENAYQLSPDVGEIARLVKMEGSEGLEDKVEVRLGVPVVPALAQRLRSADEMIKKMGKVGVEPKYDGTRVQIHFNRKSQKSKVKAKDQSLDLFGDVENPNLVRTFTRNLDETTHMFPEIQKLPEYLTEDVEEVVLDSEAVGFDPKTGKMLVFQETIQRKRKHGIEEAAKSIPLTFFVFDVLYLNGKSMVKKPYWERREILLRIVSLAHSNKVTQNLIEIPEVVETEDPQVLREAHGRFLQQGLEGALVKKWDGIYEPGRRGWSWVKFKEAEDSKAKLSDTVDAVVMGLYGGRGKRSSFGVGAFLVGIRGNSDVSQKSKVKSQNQSLKAKSDNYEEGKFYTISKVGTGLSDEQWRELKERSKRFEIETQPKEYSIDKNLAPDVWLEPGLVVEIAADEVTRSPIHTAGVALRFPRLVRFRDDKNPEQATSLRELEAISSFGK